MNHYQIIPECYADTLLVEMLGFDRPNHQLGIGKVIGMFEKGLKNRIAVGIIDDDKVKPKDFDKFQVEAERDGIKRLIKDKHSILVIKPVFEDWVFENAAAVEVEPSKFGFHSRKQFREACKKMDAKKNPQLRQFLNTLKQKQAPGFTQLKTWICEGAGIDENDL
jgi:hypothetical protein